MRLTVRRRAGRGDIAAAEAEQCIAAKTIVVRRRLGTGMQKRLRAGDRCRLVGRLPSEWGKICSSHHMHGFIPFVAEPLPGVSASIALRMAAVLEATP